MLRFVNIEQNNIAYEGYLLVEDVDDLKLYYEKFRTPQIKKAKDALREEEGINSKLADFAMFGFSIKTGMRDNNAGGVLFLADLMGKVYMDQLQMVMMEGKKLAMGQTGGYFPLAEEAVIEEMERDTHETFKPVM